jgi:taurine dioxygenase
LKLRRITPSIGVEILDVDVRMLDDAAFGRIYQAFLDHIVVVLHAQELSIEEFLAYSRRFGELKPHLVRKSRHPDHPAMMVMDNRVVDTKLGAEAAAKPVLVKRGAIWHTDTSYDQVPAKATQLHALAVPSRGGDTLFASMYEAYDALPPALKQRLEGLQATYRYGGRLKRQLELLDEADRNRPSALHPLVQTHAETGRKTLYFNVGQVMEIVGLEPAESDDLIAELTRRTEKPDGDYRHRWHVGDIVIWDNRCAIHSATGDYPPDERRAFRRVSIMGDNIRRVAAA